MDSNISSSCWGIRQPHLWLKPQKNVWNHQIPCQKHNEASETLTYADQYFNHLSHAADPEIVKIWTHKIEHAELIRLTQPEVIDLYGAQVAATNADLPNLNANSPNINTNLPSPQSLASTPLLAWTAIELWLQFGLIIEEKQSVSLPSLPFFYSCFTQTLISTIVFGKLVVMALLPICRNWKGWEQIWRHYFQRLIDFKLQPVYLTLVLPPSPTEVIYLENGTSSLRTLPLSRTLTLSLLNQHQQNMTYLAQLNLRPFCFLLMEMFIPLIMPLNLHWDSNKPKPILPTWVNWLLRNLSNILMSFMMLLQRKFMYYHQSNKQSNILSLQSLYFVPIETNSLRCRSCKTTKIPRVEEGRHQI